MSANRPGVGSVYSSQARFTAKLTEAAYTVALRHRVSGSWIDLQLDLWRVLTEAVEKGESPSAEFFGEFEASRAGFWSAQLSPMGTNGQPG
jgi:hypothetical protein